MHCDFLFGSVFVDSVRQHDLDERWRFTLSRLLVAITTIALALGALRSPLPHALSIVIACSVPAFWTGMALVTLGSGLITSRFVLARAIGEFVVLAGFALAIVGFLFAFTVAVSLFGLLALWFYGLKSGGG